MPPCSGSQQANSAFLRPSFPFPADGVLDISLAHHLNYQQMDSFSHGPTNPFRNAARTIRSLVNDRREYLVGIVLLLIVVILWALSNFITQVGIDPFQPYARLITPLCCVGHFPSRIRETVLVRANRWRKLLDLFRLISCSFLRVTWLNTSAFSFYLIPLGLKKLLGKESHDASHRGACAISS